ncbi:HTTM domain-containing protein [Planktosalinus lacus]|uniref:Type I deoxyribonuclease HsdR n=1 Tax=Planktosalinus lacus TaxID=1526573 RepID=A0A8J2Y8D8_9FLAO|nr:HTTM domain-containing protein [Planktosalinus lacus]GGD82094.1 type I deoxyribonuclease HsdR [Planktosalinus lacus]
MFNKFLFKHIDNSGLIIFRVVFGLLITLEAFGAIATGWVKRVLIEPQFTFSFIDFPWLQPLPGDGMYYYFALMGVFGLMVMLGYKYRLATFGYLVMWAGVYFMQKSAYNNHYYLMLLLLGFMSILPANRWFSLDAKFNPEIKKPSMPRWCALVIIFQVWIVYTYASVAKLYPDWLDASMAQILMSGKANYWLIGDILQQTWVHWSIAYTGILFDLLIVPLLLWKRTRMLGFVISIFFHLFNSIVFQIGIFPYMSIAFALFFFTPKTIQKRFLPKKEFYDKKEVIVPAYKKTLISLFSIYFIIQIALPLRHWAIEDNVLWTEEGHRLSWRMMLRTKSGTVKVTVKDKKTGEETRVNIYSDLTTKQRRGLATKPDYMWQYAQRLKKLYASQGKDVAVYFDAKMSVNNRPLTPFINPTVDLGAEKWYYFKHHTWILPAPEGL